LNIKSKSTLLATAAFAVLLAVVCAVTIYRIRADFGEVLGAQQFTLVRHEAQEIDEKFALRLRVLRAAAGFVGASSAGRSESMDGYLARLFTLAELFDDLFLFSADGAVLDNFPFSRVRQASKVADRKYFQDTLSTKAGVISDPYVGKGNGQPSVMLTAPVLDAHGRVVAVLGGQLNLLKPNFLGTLGAGTVGKTGEFKVISRDRVIVVSHEKNRIMAAGPAPGLSPYFDRAMTGAEGWEEGLDSRGHNAVISYKQLASVPWALVAAIPVEEAYAPVADAQNRTAWFGFILTLLLAPLIWLGVRHLLNPLIGLRDAIRQMRQDPNKAVALPERNGDEIGDLSRDFNALIRERAEARSALQESETRFREVTDNVAALIGYIDAERCFRFVNRTHETWMGVPIDQFIGRRMIEVAGADAYSMFAPFVDRALSGERVEFHTELLVNGHSRAVQGIYVPHRGADGRVEGFYAVLSDISQLKEAEQRLTQAAHYDALTGAANRSLFLDRLEQAALRGRRNGSLMALLYLDIDRFKSVNDSLGHAAGDQLLREFASRLRSSVRAADTVARLGGDEFVVLLEDLHTGQDAEGVAEKILTSMRAPAQFDGREIFITTSIGIALYDGEAEPDELMRRADQALYQAKAGGRNAFRFAEMQVGINDHSGKSDCEASGARRKSYSPVVDLRSEHNG
jgi:diguanylate cyclase (GGDEF)-like protein/PAS domain S-box-containing protein